MTALSVYPAPNTHNNLAIPIFEIYLNYKESNRIYTMINNILKTNFLFIALL